MFHKLINFQNTGFIFDLFLENNMSLYYEKKVMNTITKKTFEVPYADNITKKNNYIVKDIPDYLKISIQDHHLSCIKIKQYQGYLVNLKDFKSVEDFINNTLNTRNRKNLNAKTKKLYKTHNISTVFYFGYIDINDYHHLFDCFLKLLKIRFDEKKTHNRYIRNWKALQASTYQKIIDKKASLHVVYDSNKPIAMTLNFHRGDIVFSHIQTYDTHYAKYNMGDISMLNHLQWLIDHKLSVFDLSMGKTYYKEKWCNKVYNFNYHIFYNKKSMLSTIGAQMIALELKCLQYLRNKQIVGKLINFDKIKYLFQQQ